MLRWISFNFTPPKKEIWMTYSRILHSRNKFIPNIFIIPSLEDLPLPDPLVSLVWINKWRCRSIRGQKSDLGFPFCIKKNILPSYNFNLKFSFTLQNCSSCFKMLRLISFNFSPPNKEIWTRYLLQNRQWNTLKEKNLYIMTLLLMLLFGQS